MASRYDSAVYSPYGAHELKAKYQKNYLTSNGIVTGIVLLILLGFFVASLFGDDDAIDLTGKVIKTVADLGPPPSVAQKPPQVQVQQPDITLPKVGIPKPVADEELIDEDVVLATREELAEIQAPDIGSSSDGIVVDIDDDFIPAPDDFVPVEIMPEMIYKHRGDYPRMAKQANLEGETFVRVLVMEDGSVKESIVQKSSGVQTLDDAAVAWAKECKFKPAIQNGRPVKVWVSFSYDFKLTKN